MRKRMNGLALLFVGLMSVAGEPLLAGMEAFAQSDDTTVESQATRKYVPGVRPQRFFCLIQPPESADVKGLYSCPSKPGRVGGRCRCSGVVGNGTLYAR
jgi:hypothetical protein